MPCRAFNGTSDHINGDLDGAGPSGFTYSLQRAYAVAFWIKAAAPGSAGSQEPYCEAAVNTGNQFLQIENGDATHLNKMLVIARGNTGGASQINGASPVYTTAVVFDSTWHHFIFTQDGIGKWAYYVDGVASGNGTYTPAACSTNIVTIGAARVSGAPPGTSSKFLNGKMAHVAVFGRKLSDKEAAALYAGVSPLELNPYHLWPLNGGIPERDHGYRAPVLGRLHGTKVSWDGPGRAPAVVPRTWRDMYGPILKVLVGGSTPIADADSATATEGAESITAAVAGSDSATETEGTPTIGVTAADTASLASETASVVSSTPTAKSDSDSATVDDEVATGSSADFDTFHLTEAESVASITPTAITDSDSAAGSETSTVTPSTGISSNDTAQLTDSGAVTVVGPTDLNDQDGAQLTEMYALLVEVSANDGGTLSENDGGPLGGGSPPPTDGGGTGSGGGPGVVTKLSRRSIAAVV